MPAMTARTTVRLIVNTRLRDREAIDNAP